jgi:predicted DNA-binding WGR domain protein
MSTTKKVSAQLLLDQHCKHKNALIYDNGGLYTCTLNQTDIKTNKNKFYIMQVLQTGKSFSHYIRYGRIGEVGVMTYNDYGSAKEAVGAFEKQFKAKTGNSWASRGTFKHKTGKYFMSDISYEEEAEDIDEEVMKEAKVPDSKLDSRIQDLLKILSDQKMMQNALIKLEIDPKKMPLGKIDKKQLDKGQAILKQLLDLVDQDPDDEDIDDLSSQFYTLIPYSCGRKIPPRIDNTQILAKYMEMLDELRNIEVAVKITEVKEKDENPLDTIYKGMNNEIKPLDKSSKMWKAIEKYVKNTHAPTHTNVDVEIIDIYEVSRKGEKDRFRDDIDNHQLLFHGSGLANWISILSTGLRMPQSLGPGVFISGAMLSSGIYSANSFSKSFNYCRTENNPKDLSGVACLLLNEVALGTQAERIHADYYITKESLEAEDCHSTWGKGETTPSSVEEIDNIRIPNGKLKKSKIKSDLLYDEFVVYDITQIKQKYLLLVKNRE